MGKALLKWLPAVILACGFSTSASADMYNGSSQAHHTSDETRFREITPNAGPRVTNGADVFITADFIYWTGRMDGLGYARTGMDDFDGIQIAASPNATSGSTKFPPRKFDPGFKAGIGLNLGHDGWDIYLNYTWFHSNHTNSSSSTFTDSRGLVPLWDVSTVGTIIGRDQFSPIIETFVYVQEAKGKFRLRFNNFDLELGRNYYISQYLTLRPHIGLKGCWYKENYNVTYTTFLNADVADEVDQVRLKLRQHYWGVGIRTGLDTAWYFDKNWSIFGDVAFSGLWGRFDVTRRDFADLDLTDPTTTVKVIHTSNDFHTMKPVLEFELGLRFDYWFSDDDYHFGIQAAWEEQLWINHNNIFALTDGWGSHGDLGFQGFTLKLRFDF
ncbi:MAG: hypothetical protein S4CHLAM37_09660 [Chlamydiia bacterium]|nr:hypothetical protein [Chlamydiia bacterium]